MPCAWSTVLPVAHSSVADAPFSGRRVPEYDLEQIREMIDGAYRIIYFIKADQIDVLAVIHGARNDLRDDSRDED
jgi:plasmid stabilization system protein ParE